MDIPYTNLAAQHRALKAELLAAVGGVLEHGKFILGEEVSEFERRFAELCGVSHAVGLNSGTDALILALEAMGIGSGDEVITVPNSFVASTGCIVRVGARPVFVDVSEDYNIDPELIEGAVTARTRAILPVHLTGRPCEMDLIQQIAEKHGLDIIEDCAQAAGAEYRGRKVGSFGHAGCFSLHPLKTLSACGDGGVVTTNDAELAERLRVLRNLGLKSRDDCVIWSGNSRLDTIQAAILLVKLKHLDAWTEKRRRNAGFYRENLKGISGVVAPSDKPYEKAVYHTFVIQADRRDELKTYLAGMGIGTAVHYPVPIHLQQAARDLGYEYGSLPVAERIADRALSLPVYQELGEMELMCVTEAIRTFYKER